jgi:CheY-like chemotaxis protein
MNQILAQQILEDYGAQVLLANNGLEAVNLLKKQNVDAVLMDIQMPVMDGYQSTRAIREMPCHSALAIIAMTANVAPEDIRACDEAGMNAHIGKPIDEDFLLSTLMAKIHK